MKRRDLMAGLAASCAVPAWAQTAPPRAFRMGVTRWPPDLTLEAVRAVDDFIAAHCDLAAPMLLGGVPWLEAEQASPFSAALNAELAYRPPRHCKMLFSIGALDNGRRALAPYWGERDNQPVPARFAGRAFDDPIVMASYARFAVRACEAMAPDWFVIGIESNALITNAPQTWAAYKRLHRHAYEAVKTRFPQTKVCFTIEALHYLGEAQGADHDTQRREMLDLLRFSDIAAFSIYPHMSWGVPRPLPETFFDFARALADAAGGKPIGVSESGYTSRTVMIGALPLFGSLRDQTRHMDLLLAAAQRDRFAFVVNFASHDFERLTARLSGPSRELSQIWTYTGLKRSDGRDKPAMAPGRRHYATALAPSAI